MQRSVAAPVELEMHSKQRAPTNAREKPQGEKQLHLTVHTFPRWIETKTSSGEWTLV